MLFKIINELVEVSSSDLLHPLKLILEATHSDTDSAIKIWNNIPDYL